MREEDLQKLNELVSGDSLLTIETDITSIMEGKDPEVPEIPKIKEEPIYLVDSEVDDSKVVHVTEDFEKDLYDDLVELADLQSRIDEKKALIKSFIESNTTGSFKTKLLKVVYTKASSYDSVDTKLLKEEEPEIAAKYSKSVSRSSSIKIEPIAQKSK
jgi:hypothetical protein